MLFEQFDAGSFSEWRSLRLRFLFLRHAAALLGLGMSQASERLEQHAFRGGLDAVEKGLLGECRGFDENGPKPHTRGHLSSRPASGERIEDQVALTRSRQKHLPDEFLWPHRDVG